MPLENSEKASWMLTEEEQQSVNQQTQYVLENHDKDRSTDDKIGENSDFEK